ENLAKYLEKNQVQLIASDIYEVDVDQLGTFNFIFMKDVIEHIPHQEKFMKFLKNFLSANGCILFAFPPTIYCQVKYIHCSYNGLESRKAQSKVYLKSKKQVFL
ncbi:MAG TPA: hypothetical protein PKD85_15120, partial [Saprospiraceae bacterium]|nr:hypothetical protein [Saprospiraceae bacterium]